MRSSGSFRFGVAAAIVVASIAGLITWSLSASTAYYKTPAELTQGPIDPQERVRVAGKVLAGSIGRRGGLTTFAVSDGKADLKVATEDVLPDTFGTGIEVVAEGAMERTGVFSASSVLTKCPSKFKAKVPAAEQA